MPLRDDHQLDLRVALDEFTQATLEHERAAEKLKRRRIALERLIDLSAKKPEADGDGGAK